MVILVNKNGSFSNNTLNYNNINKDQYFYEEYSFALIIGFIFVLILDNIIKSSKSNLWIKVKRHLKFQISFFLYEQILK
jgi:hypothetical protein